MIALNTTLNMGLKAAASGGLGYAVCATFTGMNPVVGLVGFAALSIVTDVAHRVFGKNPTITSLFALGGYTFATHLMFRGIAAGFSVNLLALTILGLTFAVGLPTAEGVKAYRRRHA